MIYKSGATNRKVNSSGSVMPVIIEVRAAESKSPPATFFLEGFATLYIASAAPGRPKIIRGNFPLINLVALTANSVVEGEASCAKNMFCAPYIVCPSITIEPPKPVCQKGI